MFAPRTHHTFVEMQPDESRYYRLPPITKGPVIVRVVQPGEVRTGPKGETQSVPETAPTDLDLELQHLGISNQSFPGGLIVTEAPSNDKLWRLRIHRRKEGPNAWTPPDPLRQYKIEAQYSSQLPILERRIPASFFHDGFEANWNEQQYIRVIFSGHSITIKFRDDLARLYDLPLSGYVIDTGPLSFDPSIEITSQKLDIGAGPLPIFGGNAPFFSFRAGFPAVKLELAVSGPNATIDLSAFYITFRFYLKPESRTNSKLLEYFPVVDMENLELDFGGSVNLLNVFGDDAEQAAIKLAKEKIEKGLNQLQRDEGSLSQFGKFLTPWLVGGPIDVLNPLSSINELNSVGYAPGPGDNLRPDGIVEPATGEIIVRYIGPPQKPTSTQGQATDHIPTGGHEDGSNPLFDVTDEDPDPRPGLGGGDFPDLAPDIGALSKIKHIVVLMQENRSFDQVLGYLSRDKINPKVDGLLPPDDPGHDRQTNRFNGRNFPSRKADKDNPPGNPPRPSATAWPIFKGSANTFVSGPCHDTDCVSTQMAHIEDFDMGGFVSDFATRTGEISPTGETNPHLRLVMDYFDGEQLPFYALLAREFAISDRWYTSHPGPTWPNRFVLLTGDLNLTPDDKVETDNTDVKKLAPIQTPTLFDMLNDRGVSWRVFEHGYSFARMFKNLTFDITNIVPFNDPLRGFEAAARLPSGHPDALPQVTLIEPDYIDLPPGNDDHPPADMADGQILVERIVKALIDSPVWNETLFIITYDEHGGFYDHRRPPTGVPPLRDSGTNLGPRVPAFFISPLIEPGAVFFGRGDTGRFFDHTSIGATILRRFSGFIRPPKVSPRLDKARDLREVLTLDQPRPRSDFDVIRQFKNPQRSKLQVRSAEPRKQPIGEPESPGDFHWMLSAIRLTTGQPPKGGLQSKNGGKEGPNASG